MGKKYNYNSYIVCQNKKIKARTIKVESKSPEIFDEIALVCDHCVHAGDSIDGCRYCKGKIVEISRLTDSGIHKVTLRDKTVYNKKTDEVDNLFKASEYLSSSNIIWRSEIDMLGGEKSKLPWWAGDRPDTWATSCIKCKARCKKANISPKCVLAGEFLRENPNSILPEKYICKEQSQNIVPVFTSQVKQAPSGEY